MEEKKEEIIKMGKEIEVLRQEIFNVDIEDKENLIKNLEMVNLNNQKINYRKRKINVLEGFAPTIH